MTTPREPPTLVPRSRTPAPSRAPSLIFLGMLGALVTALLLLVPLLPRTLVERHLWAAAHLHHWPVFVRGAVACLVLAACLPAVALRLWLAMRRVGRLLYRPRPGAWLILLGVGAAPLLWGLRNRNFLLGDSAFLIRRVTAEVHTTGYFVTYDEPLALYLNSKAYALLHRIADVDVATSYAVVSCLCGVLAVPVLLRLAARLTAGPADRLVAFGLLASSGWFALFFGSVENYTVTALLLAAYLLLALRCLQDGLSLAWPALILSLALCFHLLAGWLVPSLLVLAWARRRHGALGGASWGREIVVAAVALVAPVVATVGFLTLIGYGPEHLKTTHLAALKLIFLGEEGDPLRHYSFLSGTHLTAVANQLVLTAAPGLLALLFLGTFPRLRKGSAGGEGAASRWQTWFLVTCAAGAQLFALVWNPDLGPLRDWDLFATVGLTYGVLAAHLLGQRAARLREPPATRRMRRTGAVAVVVVGLVLNALWVGTNARIVVVVPTGHEAVHHRLESRR